MGYSVVLGCMLTALGPSLAVFTIVVNQHPYLVIVSVISSFCWMLSLMVSSIFWHIISPLQDVWGFVVVLSVLVQELGRFAFYKLYEKSEKKFGLPGQHFTETMSASLASGVGYAIAHTLVMYGSVFLEAAGPGTYVSPACSSITFFQASSYNALAFALIHLTTMVLAFDAYKQMNVVSIIIVIGVHVLASCLTLINQENDGCEISIPLLFVVWILASMYAIVVVSKRAKQPITSR